MSLLAYSYEDYSENSFGSQAHWRALQIFSAYRVFLALILLTMYWFNISFINDNDRVPELSLFLTLFYCLYSIGIAYLNFKASMPLQGATVAQSFVDLFVMILLLSNNMAMEAPIAVLITMNIAAMSILCGLRITLFFSASVTLMLFALVIIRGQANQFEPAEFLAVALYGASYFIIAFFGYLLVKRLQSNQEIADQQRYDLRSLEQLNEEIIERMRSGIIVLEQFGEVRLMNQAAKRTFAIVENPLQFNLADISTELWSLYLQWQQNPLGSITPIQQSKGNAIWLPHFISLNEGKRTSTLIFLEDMVATAQQAQQMKLASLGRFTASIAHELRNPLGAISHAVQLLLEQPDFNSQQQRLLEIIDSQSDRLNGVIKNILNLTRRQKPAPTTISLAEWLPNYVEGFQQEQYSDCDIQCVIESNTLNVKMDATQLHQVLSNLLENGLRASEQKTGKRTANIHAFLDPLSRCVCIDVQDQGAGLSTEAREKIFEPFFTEHRSGHGLGLYISSELCQANQAQLEVIERPNEGACFRIRFLRGGQEI